jgi:hypothetical protein
MKKIDTTTSESPDALLTAASVRMSLAIMKALRGQNPELFQIMCDSLMELLQRSSKLALAEVCLLQ